MNERQRESKLSLKTQNLQEHLRVIRSEVSDVQGPLNDAKKEAEALESRKEEVVKFISDQEALIEKRLSGLYIRESEVNERTSRLEKEQREFDAFKKTTLDAIEWAKIKNDEAVSKLNRIIEEKTKEIEDLTISIERLSSGYEERKANHEEEIERLKAIVKEYRILELASTHSIKQAQLELEDILKNKLVDAKEALAVARQSKDSFLNNIVERERVLALREADVAVIVRRLNKRYKEIHPDRELHI